MAGNGVLFGYELPFPIADLYTALAAVVLFLPAVVVINFIVTLPFRLFSRGAPAKAAKRD